jgi:predicted PurR-regulated permease PerM
VVISLILGYYAYLVMRPFVTPILWASVLAILFYPLYRFLEGRVHWRSIAALITLFLIFLVILGPFSYLSFLLTSEILEVVRSLEKGETLGIDVLMDQPGVAWVIQKLQSVLGLENVDVEAMVRGNLSNLGRELADKATTGVKNIVGAFFNFLFMSLTIFFFLRDGSPLLGKLRDYLPFSPEHRGRLEKQVKDMVVSTIFGGVVVAVCQGVMGGTAFYLLDVPNAAIWGTAISITSFIPVLGAVSIWGSVVVYLVIQELYVKAFILLLVGTFGISLIDNILKPIIIGERTKMPALLVLFSVLGGIKAFGLLGLIMGPMSVVLFLSVFEIFKGQPVTGEEA